MVNNFNSWKWQLQNSSNYNQLENVSSIYKFKSTPYSEKFYTQNPILQKIYYPSVNEIKKSYFVKSKDIMGDEKNRVFEGVIHKYKDRVLLITTQNCPLYCRYCTRKNSTSQPFKNSNFKELFDYTLKNNITEIILSGGDPFMLSNDKIEEYLKTINSWNHIHTIRIHTKMLATLPMRFFDNELLNILDKYSEKLWILTHFISSFEINNYVKKAIKRVQKCGIVLLNQNPVLKDINDTKDALHSLFTVLIKCKIKPYYIFQIDQVDGTAHFYVDLKVLLNIMKQLQGDMSGLALPKVIVDLPGGKGKIPVENNYLIKETNKFYKFSSTNGVIGKYFKY